MKIISFNCNSLISHVRRHELAIFIKKHKPDIICLNETKLSDRHNLLIENYLNFKTNTTQTRKGGIAILIKNNIVHSEPKCFSNTNYTATSGRIGNGRRSFMIFSVYFRKIIGTDLDYIFNLHDNILMCGDFNAKHAMWNCITGNKYWEKTI